MLRDEPAHFTDIYRTLLTAARAEGIGADRLPDFLGLEHGGEFGLLGQDELGPSAPDHAQLLGRKYLDWQKADIFAAWSETNVRTAPACQPRLIRSACSRMTARTRASPGVAGMAASTWSSVSVTTANAACRRIPQVTASSIRLAAAVRAGNVISLEDGCPVT
jgi:hypothetical protein